MSSTLNLPDSLQEWGRLNDNYEAREDAGALEGELTVLSHQIEDAWFDAPLRDRMRIDWRMLKAIWRERHDEQEKR